MSRADGVKNEIGSICDTKHMKILGKRERLQNFVFCSLSLFPENKIIAQVDFSYIG